MSDDARRDAGPAALLLKRGLLLFWAAYLSLVFTTNLLDGAKALGLLADSWTFSSGNYAFVVQTTARHGTPAWANAVLFAGVVVWEGLAAALFWRAFWAFRGGGAGRPAVYAASATGLSLWAAFVLGSVEQSVIPGHKRRTKEAMIQKAR
ncbi:MAG TPA: hypothetical protein VKD72_14800 [Gemmataceae bacterium]|nr:hypothetical protein [Gemmataceae bacterium]